MEEVESVTGFSQDDSSRRFSVSWNPKTFRFVFLQSMENRFHSSWVEAQVASCAKVWTRCASDPPSLEPQYSRRDHEAREIAYDAELRAVEWEARRAARHKDESSVSQDRILASFARFAVNALDLEPETVALLTGDFLPAGIEFCRGARNFDANLSRSDTIQACRNAWTACGLQPLLGVRSEITSSILGYSLLYPYTDNYLDNSHVSLHAKLGFSQRFRSRLQGSGEPASNAHEITLWALVAMIEAQYPRAQFPQVYECFLAIHGAQEASVAQLQAEAWISDAELLHLSLLKGGTSVLADACLARGWMSEEEGRFGFEWGALLQLGDDLQDVHEDLQRGSTTVFTRAVNRGEPLDPLVLQLLCFCDHVAARMDPLPGSQRLKDLLRMSWRSLIVAAIADAHEYFSPGFLVAAELCSPFRFQFQRARRRQLAGRQGFYTTLFDLFIQTSESNYAYRVSASGCSSEALQATL